MRKSKDMDKIMGCLFGGAAGDALGYPVEFLSERAIFDQYGPHGITSYQLRDGIARVSDDTQMTLFTANGLLFAKTRGMTRGVMGSYKSYIAEAYKDWYQTQQGTRSIEEAKHTTWLMNVPEMYAFRAPGNTCLSSIQKGCIGTMEEPVNNSKGCGGVMRVAPIGLYFDDTHTPMEAARLGAEAAALTHGHEMGYIPAALLVYIIYTVSQDEHARLKDAVYNGLRALHALFPQAKHLADFDALIRKAVALTESDMDNLAAIHQLGQGWIGDEALAIAIYCSLKYENDFSSAVLAAVNHNGDSDSTGAITGNIMGAYLGYAQIPDRFISNLELFDVIWELGQDLYWDCPIDEYTPLDTKVKRSWLQKYVTAEYTPER